MPPRCQNRATFTPEAESPYTIFSFSVATTEDKNAGGWSMTEVGGVGKVGAVRLLLGSVILESVRYQIRLLGRARAVARL